MKTLLHKYESLVAIMAMIEVGVSFKGTISTMGSYWGGQLCQTWLTNAKKWLEWWWRVGIGYKNFVTGGDCGGTGGCKL